MPFTRPCPKNGTEDKIMDYCLGLLRNKNFTAAHQRIKFYNHDSQDSVESSYLSRGAHNACNPGEEANALVLRELYTDSPPCYEECTGPGATQRYLPTDAPPSYSLNTNPSGYQQGQNGPRPISMDAPPTYEAVCEIYPPSGRLSLPGPEPGPQSPLGSPERVV